MKIPYSLLLNILLILLVIFMFKCNKDTKNKLQISQNNIEVISDSIKTIKLDNGNVLFERGVLITNIKELQKINNKLTNDIKNLSDKVIKPKTFIQTKSSIKTDTFNIKTIITKNIDSTYTVVFEHDTIYSEDNGRTLQGFIRLKYSNIENEHLIIKDFKITKDLLKIKSNLILGEKDGRIKVWLNSEFPGFIVEDIDAVILDTKDYPILKKLNNKRFNIGPYIGLQLNRNTIISPSIGIGLQYSLLKF